MQRTQYKLLITYCNHIWTYLYHMYRLLFMIFSSPIALASILSSFHFVSRKVQHVSLWFWGTICDIFFLIFLWVKELCWTLCGWARHHGSCVRDCESTCNVVGEFGSRSLVDPRYLTILHSSEVHRCRFICKQTPDLKTNKLRPLQGFTAQQPFSFPVWRPCCACYGRDEHDRAWELC